MAKMACAQCGKVMKKGGTKKMATGGVTLTQKGAGYAKAQKGGSNAKMNIFGMPQSNMGTSGQYGKMAKGGSATSKKCPPGHYWTADLGCQPKDSNYKGPLSSLGAKLGVGAGLATGVAMVAKGISDRKKRKAAEKEESMKLVNDARKIKDKLAPKKHGGGVRKTYATGGATQSFAPNRPVTASCRNGMVKDENGRCVDQRKG